ncbi:MAG: LysM peptidoglycan-binding domain-containing protein [Gemmatimonadota bacterium]
MTQSRSLDTQRLRMRAAICGTLVVAVAWVASQQARAVEPASVRWPVTEQQRSVADQVAQAGVPLSALAPSAPDTYTVKSGDTLWGISTIFLTSPWRWPELWGMNKEQIRNPHLIYPGQQLRLVKADGRARLELAGEAGAPGDVVRLTPRVRDLGAEKKAITSIPAKAIEPFLSRPLVVTADELSKYPRIVATQEGRVFLGRGDTAYARGVTDDKVRDYHVFRPARPLFDPDDASHKTPIAYEAFYLGVASVTKGGEVTTLRIEESKQEIGVGDRLVPITAQPLIAYVPHPPERPISGRIISVYGGVNQAGTQSIVALNRGARDGLEVGHVLALLDTGATVRDRTVDGRQFIKLPDERIGEMFVFRVAETISYGLIMRVTKPVKVGDRFVDPDSGDAVPVASATPLVAEKAAGE